MLILQVRVQKRLVKIRELVDRIKSGTDAEQLTPSLGYFHIENETSLLQGLLCYYTDDPEQALPPVKLPECSILPLSFHKSTLTHHTSTTSASGPTFSVKPTEVSVHTQFPLFELKVHTFVAPTHIYTFCYGCVYAQVPSQYQLLGYTPIPPPLLGTYIPPGLPRPLKAGAEVRVYTYSM